MSSERTALLLECHRIIAATATATCEALGNNPLVPAPAYPPNASLTTDEVTALRDLGLSEAARSGLNKLVADACASCFFELFSLMDGVADPSVPVAEPWLGLRLIPSTEENASDSAFLHDDFFDSYWDYRQLSLK